MASKIFSPKHLITFIVLDVLFLFTFIFVFYGPWPGFRNFWITTSMTTMSHRYLAEMFYSDETIQKVLVANSIISNDITDPSLIKFRKHTSTLYKDKYEKEILDHDEDDIYKLINIKGLGYYGYLVAIYDPSRVELATTKYLGQTGEDIITVSKREKALIAMNGGGFYDPNWNSNGALPHGIVIKNGKVISEFVDGAVNGGFIGFDNQNRLILGKMSKEKALSMNFRDAIEFGPFLIVNGKRSFIKGNGGWGVAPRSVIGQREDGIVLFLVINGRIPTSIGADMNDLCDIMENYGAINAANLDGGASSELVINHKIVNKPVAGGKDGLRYLPTFWVVK
ncbi:MAG: phosphodiester glycosidase family protein [Bacilli bacterium]|nr:phosphodiester glycosidase family protein [Bacilli bacterium]